MLVKVVILSGIKHDLIIGNMIINFANAHLTASCFGKLYESHIFQHWHYLCKQRFHFFILIFSQGSAEVFTKTWCPAATSKSDNNGIKE